jgi:hypothetical protein
MVSKVKLLLDLAVNPVNKIEIAILIIYNKS